MSDQKIETTKRLKTEVQTKKIRPTQIPSVLGRNRKSSQKNTRLVAKKPYEIGMNRLPRQT